MGSERLRETAWVVVDPADRVGNDVSHCLGVLPVTEEVGCDPGRQRDGQASKRDPLVIRHAAVMEAHVEATRLPPARKRELVTVGGQVSKTVESCGRPVRDDALGGSPVPGKDIGCELQPGSTELDVVRRRCPGEVVHTLSNPLQRRLGSEALEGGGREARAFGLTARDESPLVLGDVSEPVDRRVSGHCCCMLAHI